MTALLAALSYAGVAVLLGSALARRWLTPHDPRVGVATGAAGLAVLALAWAGQVIVTLGTLGVGGAADTLAYVTETGSGRAMLTGLLGATVLLAAEVAAWPAAATVLAAAVTLWGVAGVGHGDGHGTLVRALHAAHAGAMTVWVGGVLALAGARRLTPDLAARFTPAALASVGTLAATGTFMAAEHVRTPAAALATPYGQTLAVKLAVVALALLAAVVVRRAFARRRGARVALTREALVLVAVLGVTAVLSTTSPPGGHTVPDHAAPGHAATGP